MLRVKLKYLDGWNERRRGLAGIYRSFAETHLETPRPARQSAHVYHRYVVQCAVRDGCALFSIPAAS